MKCFVDYETDVAEDLTVKKKTTKKQKNISSLAVIQVSLNLEILNRSEWGYLHPQDMSELVHTLQTVYANTFLS